MADNNNWFHNGSQENHIEEDLGVPQPPEIFKLTVFFLKNKKIGLFFIFLVISLPLAFMQIDVHGDGPTFVDLDISKFLLEKINPLDHEDVQDSLFFRVFREANNKP